MKKPTKKYYKYGAFFLMLDSDKKFVRITTTKQFVSIATGYDLPYQIEEILLGVEITAQEYEKAYSEAKERLNTLSDDFLSIAKKGNRILNGFLSFSTKP